jgi:magnesium transporter
MTDLEKLVLPEIRELIHDKQADTLRETLNDWEAADLADLFQDLATFEDVYVFQCLEPKLAARTFEYLDWATQEELLKVLPEAELRAVLNLVKPDDRTTLLEGLSRDDVERVLTLLTPENQRISRSLLSYGEGTVGRLMTPQYIGVVDEWTINEVLAHVRKVGRDSESLNAVYVIDSDEHLIDDIRMREILLTQPDSRVRDLMDRQVVALKVTDSEQTAVETFRKYDRTVLPVVDLRGVMLGVVTVDDVLDVAEETATRDIQKLGGTESLDEPYIATPVLELVRKRGTWLIFLFVGEMLTASAMGFFEEEIAKAVVLALFVPLIISSGGNSGSQAATLIVRALAVQEIGLADWWLVMRRELLSGLILGLVLGSIGFARIALWSMFTPVYGPHWALIGLTVAISLVFIVLWGTLSGSMLPFLIKRCGLDPATSSAPFVATLVDVTGLIIYFTVAMLVLHDTLLKR